MKSARPAPVSIGPEGGKWWEFPDALWNKVTALQRKRLRRTVSERILPLLNQLDDMAPRPPGSTLPKLGGRSLEEIETDLPRTILAMKLYDLAVGANLIAFMAPGAGKGKAKKLSPKAPAGCCGFAPAQARTLFLEEAARRILEEAGHDPKKLHEMLGSYKLTDPDALHKLKMMTLFDPLTVSELNDGLTGRMGKLFEKDDTYFKTLKDCKPTHFLRPMRKALGKEFPKILEWDGTFMRAVAEGLEHSAKIIALGQNLLSISDPDVIRAIGKWPIEEVEVNDKKKGKKKTYITRIDDVRKMLGDDFTTLLESGAFVISLAGNWSDDELVNMKFYLPYLTDGMMKALAKLPQEYTPPILDGLWEKCGRAFFEEHIKTDAGLQALTQVIGKIGQMGLAQTPPEKARQLIEGQFMDDYLAKFTR